MEKVKKPLYKKWWFWVIVVVIIGGIGASLDDEEKSNTTEPKSSETASNEVNADEKEDKPKEDKEEKKKEEKTEFSIGEKAELKGNVIEVTKVEKSSGGDFDKPKDGKEYVIVHLLIENNSDDEISYNPFYFTMQNSNGQIENQSFTIVDKDTALSSGKLAAGGNIEGTLAFEQPIDDDGLVLIFSDNLWSSDEIKFNLQ